LQNTNNPEVKRVFDWFLGFIEPAEWLSRKESIEKHLEYIHTPRSSREKAIAYNSISFQKDKMGWYLYLAEMILTEPTKYEPIQGARVIPIFERLGTDFELFRQIGGIDEKVRNLLSFGRRNIPEPDSVLFEILVALLWKRNGWEDVSFIQEAPPEKRPDIRVASENTEWFIECKRLSGRSAYSERERQKWQKMWWHLRNYLVDKQIPAVLDIVFHVELDTLPDDFLVRQLAGKLPLLSSPCIVISNKQWQVSFDTVNFENARTHLEKFHVKMPSDQLNELIAGYRDPNRGFAHVVLGKTNQFGEGRVNNKYLTTMDFAACAFWHCDAENSIHQKARDIRKRLGKAVKQLPENKKSVVHIGLETLDGVLVEEVRHNRIFNTAQNFDNSGKDLRWIYCHLFQSYAPPDQDWVFDETVHYFPHRDSENDQPLTHHLVLAPNGESDDGVHWLRDTP
jgi:hypothetical protein